MTVMVCMTWLVPMAVFFTSIFGWQHFVGRRTVPPSKCYVQYMEDPLFNCLLQVRAESPNIILIVSRPHHTQALAEA